MAEQVWLKILMSIFSFFLYLGSFNVTPSVLGFKNDRPTHWPTFLILSTSDPTQQASNFHRGQTETWPQVTWCWPKAKERWSVCHHLCCKGTDVGVHMVTGAHTDGNRSLKESVKLRYEKDSCPWTCSGFGARTGCGEMRRRCYVRGGLPDGETKVRTSRGSEEQWVMSKVETHICVWAEASTLQHLHTAVPPPLCEHVDLKLFTEGWKDISAFDLAKVRSFT